MYQSVKEFLGEKDMAYKGFKWLEFDETEVGSRLKQLTRDGKAP